MLVLYTDHSWMDLCAGMVCSSSKRLLWGQRGDVQPEREPILRSFSGSIFNPQRGARRARPARRGAAARDVLEERTVAIVGGARGGRRVRWEGSEGLGLLQARAMAAEAAMMLTWPWPPPAGAAA